MTAYDELVLIELMTPIMIRKTINANDTTVSGVVLGINTDVEALLASFAPVEEVALAA